MTELVIATRNQKKRAEIQEQLALEGIQVLCVADFPSFPETVEDGNTFAENAAKKATEAAIALERWSIGEDSGLCVPVLDGRPGIYSARFAGEPADDARNNARLIEELANTRPEQRTAHYVCHVAVSDPSGAITLTVEAYCRGRIVLEARGTGGFGYDPFFLIPEYHKTFGELPAVVKRHLSHRARAFERLKPRLRNRLRSD